MVTQEGQTRKQEFLNVALDLFYLKGFDNTTINNIIDEVGVSKGAFYHYFNSKEEILKTIAKEYVDKKADILEKVACEKDLNALEKLNKIIADILDFKLQHSEMRWKIYKVIARNNNIKLENQILQSFLEITCPLYERIIRQGVAEGIFHTEYPEELAQLYVYISKIFGKMLFEILIQEESDLDDIETLKKKIKDPKNIKKIKRKLSFFENTLEKIFEVKGISFILPDSFMGSFNHQ